MTDADAYVILVLGAAIIGLACLGGWAIDRWPEWRQRHEAFALNARWTHAALRGLAANRTGTVECRRDPSPTPRQAQ